MLGRKKPSGDSRQRLRTVDIFFAIQNATWRKSATQQRITARGTYTYRPTAYHTAPRSRPAPVLMAERSSSYFIT